MDKYILRTVNADFVYSYYCFIQLISFCKTRAGGNKAHCAVYNTDIQYACAFFTTSMLIGFLGFTIVRCMESILRSSYVLNMLVVLLDVLVNCDIVLTWLLVEYR